MQADVEVGFFLEFTDTHIKISLTCFQLAVLHTRGVKFYAVRRGGMLHRPVMGETHKLEGFEQIATTLEIAKQVSPLYTHLNKYPSVAISGKNHLERRKHPLFIEIISPFNDEPLASISEQVLTYTIPRKDFAQDALFRS